MLDMKRREFIVLVGGSGLLLAAKVRRARAQQAAMPVIGFLSGGSPTGYASGVVGFRTGLNEAGFVEGRNVAIDHRWMDGHFDRLPEAANELVRRRVASGGVVSAVAAKAATSTIPIVFVNGSDPVKFGLVASYNRPGGNITGVNFLQISLEHKRLELLREMIPKAGVIAVLLNPNNPNAESQSNDVQTAARTLDQSILVLRAATDPDLEAALAALVQQKISAFAVTADSFLFSRLNEIVAFAGRNHLPTMGVERQFTLTGGLMAYGPDSGDAFRQGGVYTGRILKGERPADLPVMQPTKFEFLINLKTARALGLEVPPKLLARSDDRRAVREPAHLPGHHHLARRAQRGKGVFLPGYEASGWQGVRRGEDFLIGAGRRMTFPGANDWRFFTVIIEEIARQKWAWGRLFHSPR